MNLNKKISELMFTSVFEYDYKTLISAYYNSGPNFNNGVFGNQSGFLEDRIYKLNLNDGTDRISWENQWAQVKYANDIDKAAKYHDKRGAEIMGRYKTME